MAIEKIINIKADTDDAEKGVKKVADGLEDVKKKAGLASKGIGGMKKAVSSLGNAFKALGIGIVVAAVAALTEAFSRNQKIMDTVSSVLGTVQIVFTEITDVLVSVYENVAKSSENFDALGKVLGGILKLIITPFKLGFYGIKAAIEGAQLVWETSFFGSNDPEKIKAITESIKETAEAIKQVGVEALDAGKEIVNNFSEAISEATDITSQVIDGVKEISIEAAFETAKANQALENSAKLAAAQQSRLVEQYDRQAEIQRQIRDDESKSISERQAANDKLGEILEKQQIAMTKQADLQVAYAKSQLAINNNVDNQIALTEALGNSEGVLAQIEGFRSEQIVNRIALKKEEIELDQTSSDSEKERRIAQLEFEEELELNEQLKLEKKRERLEIENQDILDDIERKRELYALGTQARVDAEIEYLARKQEIDNELLANQKELAKKEKEIKKAVGSASVDIASKSIGLIGEIAGEGAEIGKGLALAQATISGIQAVQNAFTTAADSPITKLNPSYPFIQAGIAGAFSAVQLAKIASTNPSSASGGGGSSASVSQPAAPSFNLVQGTGTDQIAQSLQQDKGTLKAFVVSGDVSNQQALDRNIKATASI